MKRNSSTKALENCDDARELTATDFNFAKYRVAGKAVAKTEWQAALQEMGRKQTDCITPCNEARGGQA